MRISDWSSDVCSSDLIGGARGKLPQVADWGRDDVETGSQGGILIHKRQSYMAQPHSNGQWLSVRTMAALAAVSILAACTTGGRGTRPEAGPAKPVEQPTRVTEMRSEEHTSELQSLMQLSYAVFCLKKKIL